MNPKHVISVVLSLVLSGRIFAQTADIDTGLSDLADKLAAQIKDSGKKKVTVIDFTDLDGSSSGELGKYIAEQLNVDLVMGKRDFAVLDRANLKSILAEHKLTATGLIDPDNAKKLGQFAGVDALILGTITPKNQNVSLTAKIITTDTAEIVGAARTQFKIDDTVQTLMTKPVATNLPDGGIADSVPVDSNAGDNGKKSVNLSDDKPQVVKSFRDLQVMVQSLKIVENGEYLLAMTLTNRSSQKNIWVAFNADSSGSITDSGGSQYLSDRTLTTGIKFGRQPKTFFGTADDSNNRFDSATEIDPGESVPVSVRFISNSSQTARPGVCNLQMEIFVGHGFDQGAVTVATKNLTTKLLAQ